MGTTVQARLDEQTQAALERIAARLKWSTSKVIREGIHLVEQQHASTTRPRLIGVGCFDSGVTDMATNKKYMEGFGKSSMGSGWRKPGKRKKK